MKKFAVIGLGQFGYQLAVSLGDLGSDVLAIDQSPDLVERIKEQVGQSVMLDSTDEAALRATGIAEVDTAVVTIGQHVEVSIIITALLKNLGVPRIISRASTPLHRQILELVGAHEVINPEEAMAVRLAETLYAPNVSQRMTLPTGHTYVEIEAGEDLWGKTLMELEFRQRFELQAIALKKRIPDVDDEGRSIFRTLVNQLPAGNDVIERGDVLALIGDERRIREFIEGME